MVCRWASSVLLLVGWDSISRQFIEIEEHGLASFLKNDLKGQVLTVFLYAHAELLAKFAALSQS